jgi:hypothetical protein
LKIIEDYVEKDIIFHAFHYNPEPLQMLKMMKKKYFEFSQEIDKNLHDEEDLVSYPNFTIV